MHDQRQNQVFFGSASWYGGLKALGCFVAILMILIERSDLVIFWIWRGAFAYHTQHAIDGWNAHMLIEGPCS